MADKWQCPNIEALKRIHAGLNNRTAHQTLADMLNAIIAEFELNHTMHDACSAYDKRRRDQIDELREQIEATQTGLSKTAQRVGDLERPTVIPPGPLPAITDPEQFIRELWEKVETMPAGPGVGPDVVRRNGVLHLIRDLIENRGINPDHILNPSDTLTAETSFTAWTGDRMQRCGARALSDDPFECRLVRGHPGPHQFERWSP